LPLQEVKEERVNIKSEHEKEQREEDEEEFDATQREDLKTGQNKNLKPKSCNNEWRLGGSQATIVCPECMDDVADGPSVKNHMSGHGKSPKDQYPCKLCYKQVTCASVVLHMELRHNFRKHWKFPPKEGLVNCPFHTAVTKSGTPHRQTQVNPRKLAKHIRKVHGKKILEKLTSGEIVVGCEGCGAVQVRLGDIESHRICNVATGGWASSAAVAALFAEMEGSPPPESESSDTTGRLPAIKRELELE
jgi:hypothetical protein